MPVITAQVRGGFWSQYGSTLTLINGKGAYRRGIAQLLAGKASMAQRIVMKELDGVIPGTTATKQLKRVANATELGGVRTVETETLVSRATLPADVTAINTDLLTLSIRTYDPTPVANGDLNPLGTR